MNIIHCFHCNKYNDVTRHSNVASYRCTFCKTLNCLLCFSTHDQACDIFRGSREEASSTSYRLKTRSKSVMHENCNSDKVLKIRRKSELPKKTTAATKKPDRIFCEECQQDISKKYYPKHLNTLKHITNSNKFIKPEDQEVEQAEEEVKQEVIELDNVSDAETVITEE